MEGKARVAASIEEARANLDRALEELERVPSVDPASIGYVAHAMNSYLTVTTVTVELLQGALRDNPNPDVRIWLDGIEHVTDMMQHTIAKLLGVSIPGTFPVKLEAMNLFVLTKRACNHYGRLAHLKQVSVEYRAIGDIPLVRADRVGVAVVADNLLSNAVRFSPPGTAVQVQIMAEPGFAVCSVRDEGPGISREDQARLFNKRVRPGPSPAASPAASEPPRGFGLAVTRELIDRMKGEIWCESTPGQGSRFSFRLPAAE